MRQWITVGTYNRLTKEVGKKGWRIDALVNKGFEKLPHISGNQENHVHSQGGCMLRKDLRRP